ncbi:MAG: molybdopterin-containing oxidoreductase family protein [Pseudonocardiaceae bacterium]
MCRMCHGGCGVLITTEDGRVSEIKGDPGNPNNRGFLCAKGRASIEHLYAAERLTQPLRRTGRRGTGKFEPITWEDAYAETASRLDEVRVKDGPEAVVFAQGTDRNYQEWLFRFANSFGSPNVLGPAHVCFYPRVMAGIMTCGAFTFCDYEGSPELVVVWGCNKTVTHGDGVIGIRLAAAVSGGTRLIVVDPRRTHLAARAEHFLQLRPGTDAALALGMLHVVIDEDLVDTAFVSQHTDGFDALAEHVRQYEPETTERLTGVPADDVVAASRAYARASSAAIELGTGAQQNKNSFSAARATLLLSAITGNVDRPGGDVIWEPSGIVGRRSLPRTEALPATQSEKRLGGDRHRILSMSGWAHPGSVWTAILEGVPYPVRALAVFGSNLLVSYADAQRVRAALERVDFLMVSDLVLTPTAAMADIVLPASSWLERDQIVEHAHYVAARRRFAQIGQSVSDEEMLTELAHRLGLDGFWEHADDSLDARLAPIGLAWKDLVAQYYRANDLTYYKYRQHGFGTRSGRLAIYSEGLRRFGYEPLPTYHAPNPLADGEYILTSAHSPFYFNSEFRHLPSLRSKEPHPTAEIHPDTASRVGVSDGDWVAITANGSRVLLRTKISDRVTSGVVCASASWWYPERGSDPGALESNLNELTRNDDESPEMGSSNFRGITCSLHRVDGSVGESEQTRQVIRRGHEA